MACCVQAVVVFAEFEDMSEIARLTLEHVEEQCAKYEEEVCDAV